MKQTDAETCPSCGSAKLTLQGRVVSGKTVRELLCITCKHAWQVALPVRGRA